MSNLNDVTFVPIYTLVISRWNEMKDKTTTSVLFYADRKSAEDYAANVLQPVSHTLHTECTIIECSLSAAMAKFAFVTANEFSVPTFTPSK